MESDYYFEIANATEGIYKEKGSKFLGFAYPIHSVDDVRVYISHLHKKHNKARHFCYAYRLGHSMDEYRTNDDGEPPGTAGRPILGQIDKLNLTNTLVIVVRYFGGKLLGASGLALAYKTSAINALDQAQIIRKTKYLHFTVQFSYEIMNALMNSIKQLSISVVSRSFELDPVVIIAIPMSQVQRVLISLQCQVLDCYESDLNPEMRYPTLHITASE